MIKEIAEAINRQDYQTATRLVNDFQTLENDNPWLKFYQARFNEIKGEIGLAGQEYRKMLQFSTNPQLIAQIRQGIARLEAIERVEVEQQQQQRQAALAKAKTNPSNREMGLLILEPVANEEKQPLAQKFAQIFKIDAYSARLQIPSRSWRLYRVGAMAELEVYVDDLRKKGIPCFCQPITAINRPNVYLARYFQAIQPEATLVYQSAHDLTASITFDWSEVTAVVEGILPIFGECVDMDVRRNQVRKISILDYAQIIDLHLKKQDLIIRICDRHYHFQAGIAFSHHQQSRERQTTNRDNWNHFASYLKQQLAAVPLWSDFPPFAETTADFYELLPMVDPHLDLFRIKDTYWDTAFQLYSALIFLEKTPPYRNFMTPSSPSNPSFDWFNPSPRQDSDLLAQIGFIPGFKELLTLRQVHALEHATVWVLSEMAARRQSPFDHSPADNQALGGLSTDRGFYLYGQVNTNELQKAAKQALHRLKNGEGQLALHPRCGTNLSVTLALTAGLVLGTHLIFPRGPISQLLGLGLATATAFQIGPDVGMSAQKYLTTAIPFNLTIVNIAPKADLWGRSGHFVQTEWQDLQ